MNNNKNKCIEDESMNMEDYDENIDVNIQFAPKTETNKITSNPFFTRGFSAIPPVDQCKSEEYKQSCCKLASHDWVEYINLPQQFNYYHIVEVRFKNSHKDFFLLPEEGVFNVGEIVAVEANPGHDIGIISMTGVSVKKQLAAKKIKPEDVSKKLYRHAKISDIDKWIATVDLEHTTMLSSRYIAWDLNLEMKVNDVEYQGDGGKAIFYYSADERVDFRTLIKILAEQFKIRIEMRQIGVRQEAARLGGIGSCGRELCCSSWLTNFQSVSTVAAKTQQLTLNPKKIAGMCGKLKCCLNFEQETYLLELKEFPQANVVLHTKKGKAQFNKIDIFKKVVWYNYASDPNFIFAIPLEKVRQIIEMNKKGKNPESLEEFAIVNQKKMDDDGGYSLDDLKNIEDR